MKILAWQLIYELNKMDTFKSTLLFGYFYTDSSYYANRNIAKIHRVMKGKTIWNT